MTDKALMHKVKGYDAGDLERPAGDHWISMSNALTRAGHGLTLGEKRIVMIAISQLDSVRAPRPGECPMVRISAAEYAQVAECEMNAAYEALQTAAKNLYSRSITFFEPAHKRKGLVKVQMRWVGAVKYHEGEGWVELHFWHQLVPHLMGLKRQFTAYQLQQASALRSVYSWRLLELLTRFKTTGWAEYTIEDFATSMDAPPSLSDFGQIKRRIIEPAVHELTEKDGWLIQWRPIKAGRKVRAIRFDFARDPQHRLPLEDES
jgi:plasmid replication initiation protein